MGKSYSRDDVQTHWDHGSSNPAVNIKCHLWENGNNGDFTDAVLSDVAADTGNDAADIISWWRAKDEEQIGSWGESELSDLLNTWQSAAAEDAFDDARTDAAEVFPQSVEIWQEGRSGGWLVVGGLPDLHDWDAIALGRWRRFEKMVRSLVADHPRAVAWLIITNVYEPEKAEEARLAANVEKWASLVSLVPA